MGLHLEECRLDLLSFWRGDQPHGAGCYHDSGLHALPEKTEQGDRLTRGGGGGGGQQREVEREGKTQPGQTTGLSVAQLRGWSGNPSSTWGSILWDVPCREAHGLQAISFASMPPPSRRGREAMVHRVSAMRHPLWQLISTQFLVSQNLFM